MIMRITAIVLSLSSVLAGVAAASTNSAAPCADDRNPSPSVSAASPTIDVGGWHVLEAASAGFTLRYPDTATIVRQENRIRIVFIDRSITFPASAGAVVPVSEKCVTVHRYMVGTVHACSSADCCSQVCPAYRCDTVEQLRLGRAEFRRIIRPDVAAGTAFYCLEYCTIVEHRCLHFSFVLSCPNGLGAIYWDVPREYARRYDGYIALQREAFRDLSQRLLATLRASNARSPACPSGCSTAT